MPPYNNSTGKVTGSGSSNNGGASEPPRNDPAYGAMNAGHAEFNQNQYEKATPPGSTSVTRGNDTTFTGEVGAELAKNYGIDINVARDYLSTGSLDASIRAGNIGTVTESALTAKLSEMLGTTQSEYARKLAEGFLEEFSSQVEKLNAAEADQWSHVGLIEFVFPRRVSAVIAQRGNGIGTEHTEHLAHRVVPARLHSRLGAHLH